MTTWRDAEQYLDSLWLLDREDDRPLDFHGAFIPAVAEGLILRHTKPGDWIWDAMAGSGTTGREAKRLGRRCFMSDLTPQAPDIYEADARTADLRIGPVIVDERIHHLRPVPIERSCDLNAQFNFDLVILHPPYHRIVQFSDKQADLSNCANLDAFLDGWSYVVRNAGKHLKPKGYLAIVVGDVWITREQAKVTGDRYGCCALGFATLAVAMQELHLNGRKPILKAIVVKDIKNNRQDGRRRFRLARFFDWGAVEFLHEYIFSIQMGG